MSKRLWSVKKLGCHVLDWSLVFIQMFFALPGTSCSVSSILSRRGLLFLRLRCSEIWLRVILHCSLFFEDQIWKRVLLPWNHVFAFNDFTLFSLKLCLLKFEIWNVCSSLKPQTSSIQFPLLKPLENLRLAKADRRFQPLECDRADRRFQPLDHEPQEWAHRQQHRRQSRLIEIHNKK